MEIPCSANCPWAVSVWWVWSLDRREHFWQIRNFETGVGLIEVMQSILLGPKRLEHMANPTKCLQLMLVPLSQMFVSPGVTRTMTGNFSHESRLYNYFIIYIYICIYTYHIYIHTYKVIQCVYIYTHIQYMWSYRRSQHASLPCKISPASLWSGRLGICIWDLKLDLQEAVKHVSWENPGRMDRIW